MSKLGVKSYLSQAAASPHALSLLALCAFLDALILPLPLSALLVPLCALAPHRTILALFITVLAGQLGACGAFLLGYFVCPQILDLPPFIPLADDFASACAFYSEHLAAVSALLYPLLPLPYCLGSLAAGSLISVTSTTFSSIPFADLALYLTISTFSRLLRFSLILGLLKVTQLALKAYLRVMV